MVGLLFLLALAMLAAGGAGVVFGAPFIFQAERGMAMVVAGSVFATGGFILLGAAVIARRLGRIATQLVVLAGSLDEVAAVAGAAPPPAYMADDEPVRMPSSAAQAQPPLIDASAAPDLFDAEPGPAAEPPEQEVVGRYSSGGNAYVMFADGSVQADTPSGRHRFASLDELRAFVAAGGERPANGR